MRIYRRELLRQFGTATAASMLLPCVNQSVSEPAAVPDTASRLDRNENAYGMSEKAKAASKRETKSILNVPDDAVAKALAVAKRAI